MALLGDERVHHNVTEIDQHPAAGVVALDADGSTARLDRLLAHRVRDRLHLSLAPAGADDEQVGDRRELRNIEHEDVLGLLVARGVDHDVGHGSGREIGHRYRRCSSMYRSAASGTRYRSDLPRAARVRSSRALMSMSGESNIRTAAGAFGAPGRAASTIGASSRVRAGSRHRSKSAYASLPRIRKSSPSPRRDSSVSMVNEGPFRSSSTF